MRSSRLLGLFTVVLMLAAPFSAWAESDPLPIKSAETKNIEVTLGVAAGGPIGLLAPMDKILKGHTTEVVTVPVRMQIRLPRISPRVLEIYSVIPNGVGLNIRNDDFHVGNVRVHLFDLGLFYNVWEPVSVQRVKRELDLTFGVGIEYQFSPRWSATLDWRMFMPANIFKVLVDYGDFARLVGKEAAQGGQTWFGFSYCWR